MEKNFSVHPAESLTHENLLKTLNYIMYMSGVDPSTVHFSDETSVVKTTPNRSYGHSKKGLPAVEIQRYASNCNYTVNLLHSRFGIDNFNILEGPSNGFEMIHFFEESLQAIDHVGNPVLANRDVIVMDNCGFHHGVCCLSKRFFILEHCELTAMAVNITSVSKREKLISLWSSGNCSLTELASIAVAIDETRKTY